MILAVKTACVTEGTFSAQSEQIEDGIKYGHGNGLRIGHKYGHRNSLGDSKSMSKVMIDMICMTNLSLFTMFGC